MAWAAQQHELRQKRKREVQAAGGVEEVKEMEMEMQVASPRVPPPPPPPPVILAPRPRVSPKSGTTSWIELYRPQVLFEVVGNRRAKEQAVEWARKFTKPLLLAGPVGVGKTSLAWAVCRAEGWDVVEPQTAPGEMLAIVKEVLTRKDATGVALVFDEVDAWHGNERAEVVKLVRQHKSSRVPIVFVCEDVGKGMESVRGLCQLVRMYRSDKLDEARAVAQRLHVVTGHTWPGAHVTHVAQACAGDLRKAVVMLQQAALNPRLGTFTHDLFVDSLFDAADLLLSRPHTLSREQRDDVFRQHDLMLPMLHENMAMRQQSSVLDMAEWFSHMDILDSHRSHQLHDYPAALTSHLAASLPSQPVRVHRLQFPALLGTLSKRKGMKATLHQLRMSYDDWSLLSPLATQPQIFSWLVDAHKYAVPDFRDALDTHRPLQGVLGGGAK